MKIEQVSDEHGSVIGWRIVPDSGNAVIVFKDQAMMPGVRSGDFVPRFGGRIVSEVVYCGQNGCVHEAAASGLIDAAFVYDEPIRLPRVYGVARVADNDKALTVVFRDCPSDDQMRAVHERLKS